MSQPGKKDPLQGKDEQEDSKDHEPFEDVDEYENDDERRHRLKKSGKRFHRRPRRDKEYLDD